MRNFVCVSIALLAAVPLLCAQGQVATAISTAPFQLRGADCLYRSGRAFLARHAGRCHQSRQ